MLFSAHSHAKEELTDDDVAVVSRQYLAHRGRALISLNISLHSRRSAKNGLQNGLKKALFQHYSRPGSNEHTVDSSTLKLS